MKEYHVMWEIDISAKSPREAAWLAQKIQRDPHSTATVFKVQEFDDPDDGEQIDLSDHDLYGDQKKQTRK